MPPLSAKNRLMYHMAEKEIRKIQFSVTRQGLTLPCDTTSLSSVTIILIVLNILLIKDVCPVCQRRPALC